MKYQIAWVDATMSKQVLEDTPNCYVTAEDGEWYDFDAWDYIEATPETLKDKVNEYLDSCPRTIDVFSVTNESGELVLTEEAY